MCAAWFALFGMAWTYFGALFIGYPVGFVGVLLVRRAQRLEPDNPRNGCPLVLLKFGLFLSLAMLMGLLVTN